MRVALFSTKPYDRRFFDAANGDPPHELTYFEPRLTPETAALARGFPAVCAFVNDRLDAAVLETLAAGGTRVVALRSAGFNHVDREAAARLGITVCRVPGYSPYSVAEHAVALILALNRKLPRAYNRVRENNFSLDGLLGFDVHSRTVGVVGTGQIGLAFLRIMAGFGSRLLAADPNPSDEVVALGAEYVNVDELFRRSDIIALHSPLTPETHHLIDDEALGLMKSGVMLINTGRGGLVDAQAVIRALKSGRLGYLGLDVYEEEAGLFFEDLTGTVVQDDVFARLTTFPNVLITSHQGFFTEEAMAKIAETTLANVAALERGEKSGNEV